MPTLIVRNHRAWRRVRRRCTLNFVWCGRVVEIGATFRAKGRQQVLRNALYHLFGPVQQWTYGNGRTLTRTQNLNGQPGIVQDTAAGGISLGYQFDDVGNLKTLRNGNQNHPPKRIYGYDGLNRLTDCGGNCPA